MSLSKLSLFSMLASRIFAISRRTWILISVVILMFTIRVSGFSGERSRLR